MASTPRLLLVTAVAFGALASAASAAAPYTVAGNPSCSDLDSSWSEIKYDGGDAGVHHISDGTVSGTITIDAGGTTASFDVTPGIDAVIVKAATEATVYTYDPDATSGTVATAAKYQISHISLCYGPDPAPPVSSGPDPDPAPDAPGSPASPAAGSPAPAGSPLSSTVAPPQIAVKGAVAVSGRSALHGPSACVRKAFTVRITGRSIRSVAFRIDGRSVASTGRKLRIAPGRYGAGVHRLVARVKYTTGGARTHRYVFQRCAVRAIAPRFAG